MSHFYGELRGQGKKEVTKSASKNSGIEGHLRGWSIGVKVILEYKEGIGDVIHIYKTSGSSGGNKDMLIATLREDID